MTITIAEIIALYERTRTGAPTLWTVSRTALRCFRRHSLLVRKRFPVPKRYGRAVRRAYRASGITPPLRQRRGPWGGTVAVAE